VGISRQRVALFLVRETKPKY